MGYKCQFARLVREGFMTAITSLILPVILISLIDGYRRERSPFVMFCIGFMTFWALDRILGMLFKWPQAGLVNEPFTEIWLATAGVLIGIGGVIARKIMRNKKWRHG